MPRLSIVIPVVGAQDGLDDTLVSVLENRPANCEILVVHNRPYDDPYDLAAEVQFLTAPRRARLAGCLDLALSHVAAPIFHVLTCGVEVHPGWADAALRRFRDPSLGSVAAAIVDRRNPHRLLSAGLAYRLEGTIARLAHGAAYPLAVEQDDDLCGPDTLAAFYRTSAVQAVGGFHDWKSDTAVGADLALALRQLGLSCELEQTCLAHTDLALLHRHSAVRLGRDAEQLFWRWASPHGLVRSLASHAALVVGETVCAFWQPSLLARLAGRSMGAIQATIHKRRPAPVAEPIVDLPSVIPAPHFARERADQSTRAKVA